MQKSKDYTKCCTLPGARCPMPGTRVLDLLVASNLLTS